MSRRDDLEATVIDAGEWSFEQLAVYADELQLAGDPRGELIALDLEPTPGPELAERRRVILASLLGDRATDPAIRCEYGYVELELGDTSDPDLVARLGPLARYLRAVRLDAGAATIAATIDALSISSRPWLTSLAVLQHGSGPSPIVRSKSAAALASAAPRLDTLEVAGHGVFASFEHPTLRALRVTGIDAVLSLTNAAELLPGVAELDLRFDGGPRHWFEPRIDEEWVKYLPPVQLPALRRLDLSRNEPAQGAPAARGWDAFRFVRLAPIAPQLTHLRWPALRTDGDVANAQAALDRMDRLVAVEVPGPRASELRHRAVAIPDPARPAIARSWRPCDRTQATFVVANAPIPVQLAEAAAWLDDHYDRMPAGAREAWDYVWDVLLRQPRGRGTTRALFAELVERALAACDGRVWSELLRRIRAIDHGPGVMLPLA